MAPQAGVLLTRLGDPQALKACIAAALAGTQLEVKEAGALCATGVLGIGKLALVLDSQREPLTDSNAIAGFVGEAFLSLTSDKELHKLSAYFCCQKITLRCVY